MGFCYFGVADELSGGSQTSGHPEKEEEKKRAAEEVENLLGIRRMERDWRIWGINPRRWNWAWDWDG
jgi:hypothetical protein